MLLLSASSALLVLIGLVSMFFSATGWTEVRHQTANSPLIQAKKLQI